MLHKLSAAVGTAFILAGTFFYLNSPPGRTGSSGFLIHNGESVRRVARRLDESGLVRSRHFFMVIFALSGKPYLYAGSYRINGGMTALTVLRRISRPGSTAVRITVPEGFTMHQIADRLDSLGITDREMFLARCGDRPFLRKLGINGDTAEGYLFPDTYQFPPKSDPSVIISVMSKQMFSVLTDSLHALTPDNSSLHALTPDNSSLHALTPYEILKMASLIEKEAKLPKERRMISSVYHNRLIKGMKLDCDPTVRYALKKFSGKLTYGDLKVDSPYNTYRVVGLPPTPICSPGRESISAAAFPLNSDFLFFVAKKDGSHYFSRTYREHLRAIKRHRDGITDQ